MRVDHCCKPKREGTVGLSKNTGCDVGSCGGNAKGIRMRERGAGCGEEASVSGWERCCSFSGGNSGAGRGDLGCHGNTLSLVFLPGFSEIRGSDICVGGTGGGTWLAWCHGGRGEELGYVRVLGVPLHLSFV